jgi:hypothetical protein
MGMCSTFFNVPNARCRDHGALPREVNLGFHFIWITSGIIAAVTQSERYHKGFVSVSFALFLIYIAVLFAKFQ